MVLRTPRMLLSTDHFGHLGTDLWQSLGAAFSRLNKQVCFTIGEITFDRPTESMGACRNEWPTQEKTVAYDLVMAPD